MALRRCPTSRCCNMSSMWSAAGRGHNGGLISQLLHSAAHSPRAAPSHSGRSLLVANAVHEAMRFRPPVRGLMRKTTSDVNVGGIAIPAGSMVFNLARLCTIVIAPSSTRRKQFDVRRDGAFKNLGFGSRHMPYRS